MKLDKNVRFIDLFVRIAYLCNVCKHSHAYEEIIRSDSVRRLRNGLRRLEYDLSKISTDNIAIGDESSRFEVPLLKVYISMSELTDVDGESIDAVFDEADIWLPNQLPDQDGNGYFVSVQRLVEDDQYVIGVLSALLGQMASDSEKARPGGFAPAGKILRRILVTAPRRRRGRVQG